LLESVHPVRRKAVEPVSRSTVIVPDVGAVNRKSKATGTHEERFWVLVMATVPELSAWTVEKPAASKGWQRTEVRRQRTAGTAGA
jgi:hypothetical protein